MNPKIMGNIAITLSLIAIGIVFYINTTLVPHADDFTKTIGYFGTSMMLAWSLQMRIDMERIL